MKKLLVVCGAGHATSTIAVSKIQNWLKSNGKDDQVKFINLKLLMSFII